MRKVIILGGSGTLARAVIPILKQDPQLETLRIMARRDHDVAEVAEAYGVDGLVGDIRDISRVQMALRGCDTVFHFAALKRVEQAEYNPDEAIKTNVLGTMNIVHACLLEGVTKAIFTSTDKAVSPINVYGTSKALAERRWIQGNIGNKTKYAACRYGNVLGSRGSVLEIWSKQLAANEPITVTNGGMTRFFLTQGQAAELVISGLRAMNGAELFIPKMKSTTMNELAKAFLKNAGRPDHPIRSIAPRPGEKEHEALISPSEVGLTTQISESVFVRWPEHNFYPVRRYGNEITQEYTSDNAERFTEEDLCLLMANPL